MIFSKSQVRRFLPGAIAILVFALVMGVSTPTHAQTTGILAPVALAPLNRDTTVELVALTLDATLSESGGRTLLSGNSTFKLHNTDKANDIQAPVGFPTWAGDPLTFDPSKLDSFAVSLEGKKVTPTLARADLRISGAVRSTDWYSFTVPLAADEKKTVRYDFQQDLGDGPLPRVTYGLLPAVGWKGSIGSGRLTIKFPVATSLEQLAGYEPGSATFDGSSLTWRFTSNEPPVNPVLTLLRPSLWNDLVARRRAVQQNPNDVNAHAALGAIFKQLAGLDSPRRDSFYAQAVAELETATRLDPKQSAAHQALGALYESRAGPGTGTRQAAYVWLAVSEWEALAPTDANARKQLAEDYFYLGVDAQNRGVFTEAQGYFDKAQAAMPNGAGPLFTPERAAAQRKALNIAWAKAALDQEDLGTAYAKARAALGDSFAASFYPPAFVSSSLRVTLSSNARTLVARLTPFAARAADLQKTINDMAANWRAAGTEVGVVTDNGDVVLTITVPFNNASELTGKLAALGKALPDRAEWSVARAAVSPRSVEWIPPGRVPPEGGRYAEQVDLSASCAAVQKQVDSVAQSIKALDSAAAADADAQLKRTLLKNAQSGWQRAIAQGRVSFTNGSSEIAVDACSAKNVEFASTPFPWLAIALMAGASGVVFLGIAVLWWRARSKRGGRQAL